MIRRGSGVRISALVVTLAVLVSGTFSRYPAPIDAARASAEEATASWATGQARAQLPADAPRRVVGQEGAGCDVRYNLESPEEGGVATGSGYMIVGWAVDAAAAEGTGIRGVQVTLDAPSAQGGVAQPLPYGAQRTDVGDYLGDGRFAASGFQFEWDTRATPNGGHTIYLELLTACGLQVYPRNFAVVNATTAGLDPLPAAPAGGSTPVLPATSVVSAGAAAGAPVPSPAPTSLMAIPTSVVSQPAAVVGTPTVPPPPPLAGAPGAPPPAPGGTPGAVPPVSPTVSNLPGPTNVSVAASPFGDAFTLTWTAPPITMVGYRVVVNEPNGTQRTVQEVPGNQTVATVRGLNPRVGYSLSVIAVDSLGRASAPSNPVTTAGAPTMTIVPTPTIPPWCTPGPIGAPPFCPGGPPGGFPGAPGGYPYSPFAPGYQGPGGFTGGSFQVTVVQTTPGQATLTWTPPPNATTYTVLQGIGGGPLLPWGPASGTTASVPMAQQGATYVFQIVALGPNNVEIGRSNVSPPITNGVVGGVGGVGGRVPSVPQSQIQAPGPYSAAAGTAVNVLVRDAANLPIPGITVTLFAANGNVTPINPISDPNGIATFRVTAPAGASVPLTATAGGITLPPLSITFTP